MDNRYRAEEAEAYVARYAAWGRDLALRVYTSHLIGAEEALVLHGGGNTSVKSTYRTLLGDDVDALFVKGSGWNLGDIEPQGFPAVDLAHMRRVIEVEALRDEDMVNEQRTNMFDASSPNPSVETLLHGFLPAKFVDHSHANALLALTNHPDGEAHVRAALGDDICIVPYIMPGFDLARLAKQCFEAQPDCRAMVLMQHGLFTWGETAEEAYSDHIALVSKAEAYVAARPGEATVDAHPADVASAIDKAGRLAPLLRGALCKDDRPYLVRHRVNARLLGQINDARVDRWVAAGLLTPDHVIRTKPKALLVHLPEDASGWADAIQAAVGDYRAAYDAYFAAQASGGDYTKLDSTPRAVVVPGVGIFGVGNSVKACDVVLDITGHTFDVKLASEGLGPFEGIGDKDVFDVEYWSLEQAKLGKKKEASLQRKVALITGGAGAIGVGVAKVLRRAGAAIVLADRDEAALANACALLGGGPDVLPVVCDVTRPQSVADAFEAAARAFGGVDIVVPNAGIAHVAAIASLEAEDFDRVMAVNAGGTFLTVREAGRVLTAQGLGGHIVLVSTKNVFGPGADFGAYSASKAAAHQLCKVAALELASHGIKVNMVNPDAVFAQDGVQSGLWAEVGPDRAKAKGIAADALQEHYRQRNLLGATVSGEDVGEAVRFFASDLTPTTGASLPVDGGVATAFPR